MFGACVLCAMYCVDHEEVQSRQALARAHPQRLVSQLIIPVPVGYTKSGRHTAHKHRHARTLRCNTQRACSAVVARASGSLVVMCAGMYLLHVCVQTERDLGNAEALSLGSEPRQQAWMRATGRLSDSLVLHQCALAYLSDWSLLETATLPHGLHPYHSPHLQLASIDHAMWFHSPFRADEVTQRKQHDEATHEAHTTNHNKHTCAANGQQHSKRGCTLATSG